MRRREDAVRAAISAPLVERRTAPEQDVPMFVVLLHGAGCECRLATTDLPVDIPDDWRPQAAVVGPFVNPHPNALLGWAKAQCSAGVVARMIRPGWAARQTAGAL